MCDLHRPRLISLSSDAVVTMIAGPAFVLMTFDGSVWLMRWQNHFEMQLSKAPESNSAVASVLPTLAV